MAVSDTGCAGTTAYLGPDGTAGTFFTTASGETLPATPAFTGRYARFRARLSSTDGHNTPSFCNVHLSFTGAGLLASSCHNFAYDPAGNITSVETVTDAGTTVDDRNPVANPINALNQILQRDVNGVTWLFSWDLTGNLLGKTNGIDTFLNTWNDLNQLTRVQGPGGLDVRYTYDTSGRMLTRTSGGVTRRFTWDGFDCVRETTGSSETIYHIPDGTLHSFAVDGVVYQVHACALGSVRMITDASGAVVARLEYGAWGEEIFVSAIPALADFPYRFVGALGVRTDAETGLVYMRQRWYDPSLQRFISRDPIGLRGGANTYSYVANNPVRFIDPMGLLGAINAGAGAASGAELAALSPSEGVYSANNNVTATMTTVGPTAPEWSSGQSSAIQRGIALVTAVDPELGGQIGQVYREGSLLGAGPLVTRYAAGFTPASTIYLDPRYTRGRDSLDTIDLASLLSHEIGHVGQPLKTLEIIAYVLTLFRDSYRLEIDAYRGQLKFLLKLRNRYCSGSPEAEEVARQIRIVEKRLHNLERYGNVEGRRF